MSKMGKFQDCDLDLELDSLPIMLVSSILLNRYNKDRKNKLDKIGKIKSDLKRHNAYMDNYYKQLIGK